VLRNPILRALLAIMLGASAGLSFATGILPLALQIAKVADQYYLARVLLAYVPYTALLWAVGGWAVQRIGHPLVGCGLMAVLGLVSGLLLVIVVLGSGPRLLIAAAVSGVFYGGLAGMILGRITAPVTDESGEDGRA